MLIHLSSEAQELLRGILLNHKDYLCQNAVGEPWQASELALTEQLIDLQILKTTLTVWTLASDTNYGTEAPVFTNERDAHLAILDHEALSLSDADKSRLLSALDDPEADFYELLDTLKYYKDTFTVDQHQLTIEVA